MALLRGSCLYGLSCWRYESRRCLAAAVGIASLGKKKKGGKLGPVLEKKVLPVETDVSKLITRLCGSNLLKEGGQDVVLGSDEQYPQWLWDLHTGKPAKFEELEPGSLEYWRRVRKMARVKTNLMSRLKKF